MDKETMNRVRDEFQELTKKICKLSAFIDSPKFENIDKRQQILLVKQVAFMTAYSSILVQRLEP